MILIAIIILKLIWHSCNVSTYFHYTSPGDTLTLNLVDNNVACPGEELVYTCVSTGFSQWWTITNAAVIQPQVIKIFRKEDTLATYPINQGPYHFNFTLWSTDYLSFTSSLSTNATESLNGTRIECASAGSTLIRHISIAIGRFKKKLLYLITICMI